MHVRARTRDVGLHAANFDLQNCFFFFVSWAVTKPATMSLKISAVGMLHHVKAIQDYEEQAPGETTASPIELCTESSLKSSVKFTFILIRSSYMKLGFHSVRHITLRTFTRTSLLSMKRKNQVQLSVCTRS